MARKGYAEEYLAKQVLVERFGELGVIKVAISQFGADFICFSDGKVDLAVEVKGSHHEKYYPSERDKKQRERIIEFCKFNNCAGEIWIKYPYKPFEVVKL